MPKKSATDSPVEPTPVGGTTPAVAGYTVSVRIQLPSDGYAIHPTTHARITSLLKGRGPVLDIGDDILGVVFVVRAGDSYAAADEARPFVTKILDLLGLESGALVGLRATSVSEHAAAFDGLGQCLGVREVAAVLGVSKQRVYQLAQRADFPPPVFTLRATPVWRYADVQSYAERRVRARIS